MTDDIQWEPKYTAPPEPDIKELRAQERARRLAWQATRFEQLKEAVRA
jgi:hypothetical protein